MSVSYVKLIELPFEQTNRYLTWNPSNHKHFLDFTLFVYPSDNISKSLWVSQWVRQKNVTGCHGDGMESRDFELQPSEFNAFRSDLQPVSSGLSSVVNQRFLSRKNAWEWFLSKVTVSICRPFSDLSVVHLVQCFSDSNGSRPHSQGSDSRRPPSRRRASEGSLLAKTVQFRAKLFVHIDIENNFGIAISLRMSNRPGRCDFVKMHPTETKLETFEKYFLPPHPAVTLV